MRRALIVSAIAAALSTPLGLAASASADTTVTVPGLAFPSTDTYLTYFGCQDLYHVDSRAPQIRIDRGGAPAGARSFSLLMPGSQTAAGPVHRVSSVADTTVAGFSARAETGGSGVAYVWYVTGKLAPGQVWAGRADLSVGPAWRYVDTAAASYDWQLIDAATGDLVRDGGAASIGHFTDAHGDGPGYLVAGLGCSGEDFSIDALRYGSPGNVTTYDLEGIQTTTIMDPPSADEVAPGTAVTLSGTSLTARVPLGAAMVLQAKPDGASKFHDVGQPIPPSTDGVVRKVVRPEVTTSYRWYIPAEGYSDASWSDSTTVVVIAVESEPSDPPSTDPSDPPATPGGDGSDDVTLPPLPSQSPGDEPSDPPSDQPTDPPSDEPTQQPSDQPSDQPTDQPSETSTPAAP